MPNFLMSPEFTILAGGLACMVAVVVIVLAGRNAALRGGAERLAALEVQVAERRRLLSDIGEKMALAEQIEKKVEQLDRRMNALQQDIQPLEAKHLKALGDYEAVKADLRKVREEWLEIRDRVDVYKARISKIEALEQEILDLDKKRKELEELVASLPQRQDELAHVQRSLADGTRQIEEQRQALKSLTAEREALAEKLVGEKKEFEQYAKEIKKRQEVLRKAGDEIDVMKQQMEYLAGKIKGMDIKLRNAGKIPIEAFSSLKVPIYPVDGTMAKQKDEGQWLEQFAQYINNSGFDLPRRLQRAFHAALKTSDISCLTVMAGVSGTGKSALPRIYARAMGIHFLPIAVEPRWDSPHDLFGFLNYMENRYEAAPLGRALVQFNCSPHETGPLSNQMLMVLLDEMNLARIEYYFSEFLSRLELRRDINLEREEDYAKVSMEIYAGNPTNGDDAKKQAIRLFAGKNVLFVGTMNEDETTQSLSDKVIDRANVLHFGRPGKLRNIETHAAAENGGAALPLSTWQSWIREASNETIKNYDSVAGALGSLNAVLGKLGRPFAHRTFQAILKYIANHPDVMADRSSWQIALSDQLAMRIMPKLRGLDLNEHSDLFKQMTPIVERLGDVALSKAFIEANSRKQGYFHWTGIDWGNEE